MSDKRNIRERALIIGLVPLGDYDLIVRTLIAGEGKVSLVAKQARKSTKRFGASLDLFDCGRVEAEPGRGSLWVLKSLIHESAFRTLRSSLEKMSAASIACESFDRLLPENVPDQGNAFAALHRILTLIDTATRPSEIVGATFDGLLGLLADTGFADPSEFLPRSSHSLERVLKRIEESSDRALRSATSLPLLIRALKAEHEQSSASAETDGAAKH